MRIIIDIPKEFEEHFKQDKFQDALHRLSADAHLMAGNYEQETATMLIKAFSESKPMEKQKECDDCADCVQRNLVNKTTEVVRKGGVNE